MRIFVDNCVSPVLASTLNGYVAHLGHDAVHVRDMPCGAHTPDVVWMAALHSTGDDWLVITGDLRIQRNRPERLAFRQSSLRAIALAPAYQTFPVHQQASMLLWRWPEIAEVVDKFAAPFMFKLPTQRNAKFEMMSI